MESVYIESDDEFHIRYYGISFRDIETRYEWCEEQFGAANTCWRNYGSNFVFKSAEDALYFKMVWQ